MEVSVIIPTYNHRDFVLEAINSVFAQTFSDYEMIVIDDGSTDDTAALLRPLASAGRIRFIEQINRGQALARNCGLEAARGNYVAFLDDDDFWPTEKLEWQVACLRRDSTLAAVAGPAEVVDERRRPLRRTPCAGTITFEKLFEASHLLSPGQCLFRAECLKELGGFDSTIWGADDWDMYFRLTRCHRLEMVDRVALHYRKHDNNASRNVRRMLQNSVTVVERNIVNAPASRRNVLRRRAYRFIYNYAGAKIMGGVRDDLAHWRLLSATRQLSYIRKLFQAMARDPQLLLRVLRDIFPNRNSGVLPDSSCIAAH